MNPKRETMTIRLEQAGLWWLRLREDDVPAAVISEWLDWCQQDAANLEAFEKIEDLGGRFETLDPSTRAALTREVLDPLPDMTAAPKRRRSVAWVAGVVVTLFIVLALGLFLRAPALPAEHYETARAQQRDLRLSDGSRVALGGATRLQVGYSPARRALQLADGEAYFEVAHNPARPFVVKAGSLTVTAVGTAFNIRKTAERIEVAVTQGMVAIEDGDETRAARALRVVAGQLALTDAGGLALRRADGDAATAWRRGSLRFVDEPLAIVVANLNRYAPQEVVIADPSLGDLRYTGTILQGHETEWLTAIATVFPITVQREQSRVMLQRRTQRGVLPAS